jgi:hypothetical protein
VLLAPEAILRGDISTYRRGVNFFPARHKHFRHQQTSLRFGKENNVARHYILNRPLRSLSLPQLPSCKAPRDEFEAESFLANQAVDERWG